MTILLVDDDRDVRTLAKVYLERAGYTILTASDGEEALSVFRRHQDRIALMVTDVVMPKLGGLQLADAVLAMRPQVPVIFVSGNAPDSDRGYGCILKPFTASILVDKVQQALTAKQMGA